jgi:hypothetical protein
MIFRKEEEYPFVGIEFIHPAIDRASAATAARRLIAPLQQPQPGGPVASR